MSLKSYAKTPVGMVIAIIVGVGFLTLGIIIVVGMGYLTKFSFESDKIGDDVRVIKMTQTQVNLARTAVVMFWIALGLNLISIVWKTASKRS